MNTTRRTGTAAAITSGVAAVVAAVTIGLTSNGAASVAAGSDRAVESIATTSASSASATPAAPAAPPTAEASKTPEATKAPAAKDDLPRLFPEADPPSVELGSSTVADAELDPGTTLSLEGTEGSGLNPTGTVDEGNALIVLDGPQGRRTGAIPAGWTPTAYAKRLDLGQAGSGYVVRQEGGDSDQWRLFLDSGDELTQVVVARGPVPFGGGFVGPDYASVRTWMTPDGHLYTRVDLGSDRFQVYGWDVAGPGEGEVPAGTTPEPWVPTLRSTDLGVVCITFARDGAATYERC